MGAFVYYKTKIFEWLEQRRVSARFYHNEQFRLLDQALLTAYESENPFHISRAFLEKQKAEETYAYGETPLTTMAHIAKECELRPSDTVIEMGAGRGRAALFLAEYVGCKVIAYEQIPQFVEKMPLSKNLKILSADMFSADFSKASAVYLYGTMLLDEEILNLIEKLPKGCKVITVSYPLSEYSERWQVKKTFSGSFAWGKTEVYWNERVI